MLKNIKKNLQPYRISIITFLISITFIVGFVLSGDLWVMVISGIWIALGLLFKFNQDAYFKLAILFLLASFGAFIIGKPLVSGKMAVWEFIFLFIGTIWGLISLYKDEN